jgi:hypothetical protein
MRVLRFILMFCVLTSQAQQGSLQNLINRIDQKFDQRYHEKIYVHIAQDTYLAGETIWFKVYLLNGASHHLSSTSCVAYFELLDSENRPIIQLKVKLENGLGWGSVNLPLSVASGSYRIRAYTLWMQNFDPAFYFQQTLTIVNTYQGVNAMRETISDLEISLFPESGELIDGLLTTVGVRVVNNQGLGKDYSGLLLSSEGDTLTRFKSLHYGMGRFSFTPRLNKHERVILRVEGKNYSKELPEIKASGYSLRTSTYEDSIVVNIRVKNISESNAYLVGHTRQNTCIAKSVSFINNETTLTLDKAMFPAGILHLTLFNKGFIPVSERLVFIKPDTLKKLSGELAKTVYSTREKIQLHVNHQTNLSLSIAVSKVDSLPKHATSIYSSLYLTSDLKGNVENPDYYFSSDQQVPEATDNLMLVHGWSRFRWQELLESKSVLTYLPEIRYHLIRATGFQSDSNPLSNSPAFLSWPQKKIQFIPAVSNQKGEFIFEAAGLTGNNFITLQSPTDTSAVFKVLSPFSSLYTTPVKGLTELQSINQLNLRNISRQVTEYFSQPHLNTTKLNDSSAFYGEPSERYSLDDFTRFPLLEEVLREYVKGVRLRIKDGDFIFKLLNSSNNSIFENPPLVLLDGVPIFNLSRLMDMDPRKIAQIDVVTRKYFIGSQILDGMVSFRTYSGDLGGYKFNPSIAQIDYQGLHNAKEFFSPRYETTTQRESRLPDSRHLLYWNPNLQLTDSTQVEFYTSDIPGSYQIILQGISATGIPIFERYLFSVKR